MFSYFIFGVICFLIILFIITVLCGGHIMIDDELSDEDQEEFLRHWDEIHRKND